MEEIEKAKKEAIKQLDKLNLKNKKAEVIKRINEAKDIPAIDAILSEAKKVSDQHDKEDGADKELENAKQAALKKIETLNLKEQKAAFVKQVTEAKTITDVEKVLAQAQTVSDQHDKEDATMGNKEAFIQRKITVLNTKGSSKFERLAQRVILNNR